VCVCVCVFVCVLTYLYHYQSLTDSPQGRVGGIMSLKLHQRIDLLKKGFTHATNFKTSVIYGTQPVSLGKLMMIIIHKNIF